MPNVKQASTEILLNGEKLDLSNSTVFLGIKLDSKLQWGPHVDALAGRLASAAFAKRAIRAIYKLSPRECLREFFKEINILAVASQYIFDNIMSNIREVTDICAESWITEVSCDGADALGLLPHPDDCRLFYQCAYGVPLCHRGPPGLHFNPKLLVCDAPEQAGCVAGAEEAEFGSPHDKEPNEFGNEIPPRCIANSVTTISCAETSSPDALLAHPDDCELFYYCVSASAAPVCRQCPASLHFNPALHVCDAPQHAGCQAGNSVMDPALMVHVA